ncbi:aminoglycoside phosphotransferase family protein [Virgibacillus flavescens]|uniref:aminoglycoside phosphotransferase family protein n=1 Tax=Virgibacillus flavescens TaxID=1611422 RepID=UPI003D334385
MQIPSSFRAKIIGAFGDQGVEWLGTLEKTVQRYLKEWNLRLIAPVSNLSYNYVVQVKDREETLYILKLGVPGNDFQNEVKTIQLYDGEGCARLIKADAEQGAMLLELLMPGQMLSEVEDESLVLQHYIKVWKAIRRPLPKDCSVPMIADWSAALDRYQQKFKDDDGPVAVDRIKMARDFFAELIATSEPELLHGDLHHENILYSNQHGWMAIDPKGVGGDRYFDLISFLFNHLLDKENPKALLAYRIEFFCEELELDCVRLLKAAIAMSTLSVCWSIDDEDPEWNQTFQCTEWLVEMLCK